MSVAPSGAKLAPLRTSCRRSAAASRSASPGTIFCFGNLAPGAALATVVAFGELRHAPSTIALRRRGKVRTRRRTPAAVVAPHLDGELLQLGDAVFERRAGSEQIIHPRPAQGVGYVKMRHRRVALGGLVEGALADLRDFAQRRGQRQRLA